MTALLLTLLLVPRPVLSGLELTVDADSRVKVHYTLSGADALVHAATDLAPQNGVPDDADAVGSGAAGVIDRWSVTGTMRAPLGDGLAGGDDRLDVYIRKLDGPRGYAHPEDVGMAPATSAWLEVDPRTAGDSLVRLSAAAGHEAHHAIQYAYSAAIDPWMREASATWVEDHDFALHDEAREHRNALLTAPSIPLTTVDGRHEYDAMAFVDFLIARISGPPLDGALAHPSGALDLVWSAMRDHGTQAGIERSLGMAGAPLMYEWARHLLAHAEVPVRATFLPAGGARELPLPAWSLLVLAPERLEPCRLPSALVETDGTVTFGAPPEDGESPRAGTWSPGWTDLPPGRFAVLARGAAGPNPAVRVALLQSGDPCADLSSMARVDGGASDGGVSGGCACGLGGGDHGAGTDVAPALLAVSLAVVWSKRRRVRGALPSPRS